MIKYFVVFLVLSLSLPNTSCVFHYRTDTRRPSGHDPTGNFFINTQEGLYRLLRQFFESCPQPAGYCETLNPFLPQSNEDLCGPGAVGGIAWIIEIKFTSTSEATYTFTVQNIFTGLVALFIDDEPAPFPQIPTNDNQPAEFSFSQEFCPGTHTIKIYGLEELTGSPQQPLRIDFEFDNQPKTILNKFDGTCAAPKPKLISQIETRKLPGCLEKPFSNEAFGEHLVHEFKRTFTPQSFLVGGPYCTFYNPSIPFLHKPLCTGMSGGFVVVGAENNIFWLINIQFRLEEPAVIEFQFGVKFDNGHAVFIDECFSKSSKDPIDWAQSFENPDNIITVRQEFSAGFHEIKIYGRDASQNLEQSIRYQPPGANPGEFFDLTIPNWINSFPGAFLNSRITTRRLEISPLEGNKSNFPDNLETVFDESLQKEGYCKTYDVVYPFTNSFSCAKGSSENLVYKIDFVIQEDFTAEYEILLKGNFQLGAKVFVNGSLDQTLQPIHEQKRKRYWRGRYRWFLKKRKSKTRTLRITVPTTDDATKIFKVSVYAAEFKSGKVNALFRRNGGKFQKLKQINQDIPLAGCFRFG